QIDLYEEEGRRINVDRMTLKPSRTGKEDQYDLLGYRNDYRNGQEPVSESPMVDRAWLEKRLGRQQAEALLARIQNAKSKQAEKDANYDWRNAPVEMLTEPEPERAMQGRYKVTLPDGSKATFIGWTEGRAR